MCDEEKKKDDDEEEEEKEKEEEEEEEEEGWQAELKTAALNGLARFEEPGVEAKVGRRERKVCLYMHRRGR